MGVLIKNGTIVTALDQWVGDIRCCDGIITALGADLEAASSDEIIDASGQLVFPGGIDPHVHLSLPLAGTISADDFESGTAAGVAGGTTAIIDFVTPDHDTDPRQALLARRQEAQGAVTDWALHMVISRWRGSETREWMRSCVEEEGITSFKVFLAYKDVVGMEDEELIQTMKTAAELGAVVAVHAEHGEMIEELRRQAVAAGHLAPKYHALTRPSVLEGEATARALLLARMTGATAYIVHVTCRESTRALAEAREAGQEAYGETCPQYLVLDDSVYERGDLEAATYVMSPPIRPQSHQEPLWSALRSGILHTVGTDHCPFNLVGQKDLGRDDFRLIPNGAAGIEHRLAILYSRGVGQGRLSLQQFVDLTSTRAARIFGLYPRKGSITVGADADLVVWDPQATQVISARTHRHRCDTSIFEGLELQGKPSAVVANGRIQYWDGDLRVERGTGRYLARSPRH